MKTILPWLLPAPELLEGRIAPAALALGALDGTNGFRLSGVSIFDLAGTSVSQAGDVNGDGIEDLIIGAPKADPLGTETGAAYVVFGKSTGFPADFDLGSLNGANGFVIRGENTGDEAGISVSAAGDVNNDTFDDVIVGARSSDSNGVSSGSSYVVFGKGTAFSSSLALSGLTGTNGFKMIGATAGELSGSAVSGAGDVNNDGFADVIVGAPGRLSGIDPDGAVYVVFGKASFGASVALSGLTGTNGFAILGKEGNTGTSVSNVGDANGDGVDDIIVGAPLANGTKGVSYLLYGKATAFAATLDLSLLSPSAGVQITGLGTGDQSGFSVSDAGDINGDGLADVLIGAKGAHPRGTASGASYVIFGRMDFPAVFSVGSLNGRNGFKIGGATAGEQSGYAVSAAGDFNHDGRADLLIGAPARTDDAFDPAPVPGGAYLIYGKPSFPATLSLFGLKSTAGFRIAGEDPGDRAGFSVSAAGDFNGDGTTDLLIGAPRAEHSNADTDAGAAYVVFGQDFAKLRFASAGRIATFGDVDGDLVTVRVTGGSLDESNFTLVPGPVIGFVFQKLDLSAAEFRGVTVSISAVKPSGGSGDGVVNLGFLDATGHDLGTVAIDGDLGQIDAGETALTPQGVRSLSVGSLGTRTDTQPLGTVDPVHSEISGSVGAFRAAKNVAGILDVSTSLGPVLIGGSIDGSAGGGEAGLIRAGTGIGNVGVRGSIVGGATFSGVLSGGKLGKVGISHDLTSADASKPVLITAFGKVGATSQKDTTAIASLSIGGNVLNAQILAGYTTALAAMNGDAAIGKVSVKGNWDASDLVAGAKDATADGFGRNDALIGGGNPLLIARIASISIKGTATGSTTAGDYFGLVAEQVLKAKIAGVTYTLTPGVEDYSLDAANFDFHLEEVV